MSTQKYYTVLTVLPYKHRLRSTPEKRSHCLGPCHQTSRNARENGERSCLQLETGPGERVIACPWRTVACERPAPAVLQPCCRRTPGGSMSHGDCAVPACSPSTVTRLLLHWTITNLYSLIDVVFLSFETKTLHSNILKASGDLGDSKIFELTLKNII